MLRVAALERLRLAAAVEEAGAAAAQAADALALSLERHRFCGVVAEEQAREAGEESALEAKVLGVQVLTRQREMGQAAAEASRVSLEAAAREVALAEAAHIAAVARLAAAERLLARHDRVAKLRESRDGSGEPR